MKQTKRYNILYKNNKKNYKYFTKTYKKYNGGTTINKYNTIQIKEKVRK